VNAITSRSPAFHFIFRAVLFSALVLILTNQTAHAEKVTWTGASSSDSWYSSENWSPAVVPNGPRFIADFAASEKTSIDLSIGGWVSSIIFEETVSSFSFDDMNATFWFTGTGIINNSDQLQSFDCTWTCYCTRGYPNSFNFYNQATAGELTEFTVEAAPYQDSFGGEVIFWDFSTAGSSTIRNLGGGPYYTSGSSFTYFEDYASAENATIINEGGGNAVGVVWFEGKSTAAHATIINNGAPTKDGAGGAVLFTDFSDSGDSTIICNGDSVGSDNPALVEFTPATGGSNIPGRTRIMLFGNGKLDVDGRFYGLEVSVGSIEGEGQILLGDAETTGLSIGTNNLSTIFAGLIQDKVSLIGGSFTKVGAGTLTLTSANTYTGGTTIQAGQLKVNNTTGSGTGTGAVQVNAGTLSGHGTVAGTVTVGTGAGAGAFLAPGDVRIGTLTIQSAIIFNTDANYSYNVNTQNAQTDEVIANGVTIDPGAIFSILASGHSQLATGTVFTAINNTADTPISGAFGNLADGSTVTVGGNNFQADYEGGDGNDLTLTVVP